MSTLGQLRQGMAQAWDHLVEGWEYLRRRAAGALTRFTPSDGTQKAGSRERRALQSSGGWGLLAAEVYDDGDRVVVRLEAPGLDKSDLDVRIVDDYLVVRGEKRFAREHTRGRYHVAECAYGHFERAIPLPGEVEQGQARADYTDGVLRIELPKSPTQRNKKVKIEVR